MLTKVKKTLRIYYLIYLKNLMELELVEKVLPGTYEISNSFIRFYFRFLFPHQTAWRRDNGRAFYET